MRHLDDKRAPLPAVPGYSLRGCLGTGGFGDVWDAVRTADGRTCAVKLAHRSDAIAQARFRREADALARIGAPHVPTLFGSGQLDDGRPFIAMERIAGQTLGELIEDVREPIAPERVCAIGNAVLAALEFAHVRGVVHRDLKPDNIFLVGGRAVLTDFGIAVDTQAPLDTLTPSGVAVGTAEYMSPEQIAGGAAVDERSDLYAFGVVLYELVTLRVPFGGETGAIQRGHAACRPPRPSRYAAVPRALERLILGCLAKRPADRPTSASDARRRLAIARADSREVRKPRPPSVPRDLRVAGAAQPAVIAVIDSPASAEHIADAVRSHQGFVARHRGERYVAVFTSLLADDPLAAAMTCAHAIADDGDGRVAIHLSDLVLRRRPRGDLAAYGAAIEAAHTWLPETWTGVWASTAATDPIVARGDITAARPLIGRGPAVATLATSARAAFAGGPGLATIVGDYGTGKSRLAAEATRIARNCAADVIQVRCRPPVERGTSLLAALGADDRPTHRGDLIRAIGDALRSRARLRPIAVVVDDAHWADGAVIDALEYASLAGDDLPLWLVVAARPLIDTARPTWGHRAHRAARIDLAPLSDDDTRSLAADCLRPAEYPPADLLARVARWSGGNPRAVVELVHALKRDGIVRQLPRTSGWIVATAELDRLETSPAGPWLAARLLDELSTDLTSLARLCAVLGDEVVVDELEWVLDELDRAGADSPELDARVGLEQLVLRGVLVRAGDQRYAWSSGALGAAVYQLVTPGARARLHRCALTYWQGRTRALDRVARHARACNEIDVAVDAHLELGDTAARAQEHCLADRHYTDAIELLGDGDSRRLARARFGRGAVRYRIDRASDAVADLDEAAALADEIGDPHLAAAAYLQRATALDWAGDYAASATALRTAETAIDRLGDPALSAQLAVGRGRVLYREQRIADAARALEEGAAAARAVGERESELIALLMLGPALAVAGRLNDAERAYADALVLCDASSDPFHECALYANRLVLRMARLDHDGAVADLRRAMKLAREIGHSIPEIATTVNLAELLFWRSDDDEALDLATRARSLRQRFVPQDLFFDTLLLARLHAARDNDVRARELLAEIESSDDLASYTAAEHALREALHLTLDGADGRTWDDLVARHPDLPVPQRVELLYWRARAAIANGNPAAARAARETARKQSAGGAAWTRRFDQLFDDGDDGDERTRRRMSEPVPAIH